MLSTETNNDSLASKLDDRVQEKTYVIFGANGNWIIDKTMRELGWKPLTDKYSKNFNFKWVESRLSINYDDFKEGEQIVNRIPNCYMLTNKLGLLVNLHRFHLRCTNEDIPGVPKLKLSEFLPETYRIDDQKDREFFEQRFKPGEVWISKPIGLNQGRGIYLVRDTNHYHNPEFEKDSKGSRLIQKYIVNPLLIDGRKFDIRVYMLISSTKPFMVLFRNGYVRLSLQKYEQTADDITVHLTNQFIQKRSLLYDTYKNETILSFEKFNDYINKYVEPFKKIGHDWVLKSLTHQMKNIALFAFLSVKDKLKTKIGLFDLYGIDFLIDDNMKVWLLEVNVNPCLSTNCDHLKKLIPNIIKETINVSLECFKKSWDRLPLLPCNSLNSFEVLYQDCFSGFKYSKNVLSYGMTPANKTNEVVPLPKKKNIISVVFEASKEDKNKSDKNLKKSMFEIDSQDGGYNGSDYSAENESSENVSSPTSGFFENKDTELEKFTNKTQFYNKEVVNVKKKPSKEIKDETVKKESKSKEFTYPPTKKTFLKKIDEIEKPIHHTPNKSKSFTKNEIVINKSPSVVSSYQDLNKDFKSNDNKISKGSISHQNGKFQKSSTQDYTQYQEEKQGKARNSQQTFSNSSQFSSNLKTLLKNSQQSETNQALSTMKILKTLRPNGTSSVKPDYIATNKLLLQTMSKMNAERKIKNLQDTYYNQSITQFNF